jgi:hypothetical protein
MYRLSPASSVEYARKRGKRRATTMLVQCGLLLLSVLLGRVVVETQMLETSAPKLVLAALGVMVATAVMLVGPALGAMTLLTIRLAGPC